MNENDYPKPVFEIVECTHLWIRNENIIKCQKCGKIVENLNGMDE